MLPGGQQIARCLTTKTRIDAETETLIPTIGGVFVDDPIAFDSRQDPVSSSDVFGALGSSSPQAQAVCVTGQVTHTLKAEGFDASEDGTGRGQPIVAAAREIAQCITSNYGKQCDNSDTALGPNVAIHGLAVRRLTPRECERLQGFPDDHTLIPVKKIKPERAKALLASGKGAICIHGDYWQLAADGPRYKALGNSMAVPCMHFIGRRIQHHWNRRRH